MRSLLGAIVIGLVASLAVVFAVQWSLVRVSSDAVIRDYIADELAHDSEELVGAITFLTSGELAVTLSHHDPPFLQPYSGRYYHVRVEGMSGLRSPSLADGTLVDAPVAPGEHRIEERAGPREQRLLVRTTGYAIEGRRVTVAVAADLVHIRAEFGRLMTRYTQVSLALFALLVVLQIGIVRIALSPLTRARDDVRRLEHGEIAQLGERVPAEVLPLVREVNRLLALLAGRLQRSRESLGNLAHALKAPLTVLTHIAEDDTIRRDPALREQMSTQLGTLRARIDAELRRARVGSARESGRLLELSAEIEALVATLRKLHRDKNLAIECRIAHEARFRGDREDLLELCGNLLDNACKWARSRIAVTVRDGAGMTLVVEDDGPGCSAEQLQRIARRGVRLDESTEGHGLGLAIAGGIVRAYGGEMSFGRSAALGGFQVTVTLSGSDPAVDHSGTGSATATRQAPPISA